MNRQLPPIDQDVRAQLARRSAGRLPEGLTTQVLQAVDRAPVKPRYTWRAFSPRPARAIPRTLLAGAGLAAVVLLAAALVVVPRFQTTPASGLAGYPADRALTTAELAALMAGPALPVNTALVASVTIDPRTEVCPMDRYGTLGVVDGMSSQVCVMGTFDPYTSRTTATFAFRYLAPGYLGLLGAIVPPSELGAASNSKLAFRPSEQWPNVQSDKPFLVEGWLGSSSPPQSVGGIGIVCPEPLYGVGDPLDPMGPDNTCNTTWLADDPSTVPSWEIADGRLVVSVQGGHEAFAGGARFYDSIPNDAPVKGVYVVRSQGSAMSCGLPSCREWVVMAKVAEISLPQATAAPTTSLSGYPAGRALTAAELASLMAGPALPTNAALVASVTIDAKTDVCPMNRYPTIGVIEGMGTQVCVMGAGVSTYLSTPKAAGVFAFRYLAPGVLGLVGEITPASSTKTALRVVDDWPLQGKTFLVDGWLGAVGLLVSCAWAPTAGDILLPDGGDCPYDDWLGDDATAPGIHADHGYGIGSPLPSYDPLSLRGNARHVGAGGIRLIDSIDPAAPVHGVFVVRSVTEGCPGDPPESSRGCGAWLVLAKLADISLPAATASPIASPSATSRYPTDRALTTAELGGLLDSGALEKYDTVVVDAEVTAEASGACQAPQASGLEFAGFIAGLSPQTCVYSSSASGITPGHLVLRVLDARSLGYMGTVTVTTPPTGPLAYDPTGPWPKDYGFFLVHGWLDTATWTCGSPGSGQPGASGEAGPSGGPNPLFPVFDKMCHAALTKTKFIPPDSAAYMTPIPAGPPRILYFGIPEDGKSVDAGPYLTVPSTTPSTSSTEGTYLLFTQLHYSAYGTQDPEDYYVLARLADIVVPASPPPTPAPTPTPQPPATPTVPNQGTRTGYPFDRAMTTGELAALLADPSLKTGTTFIAGVTIQNDPYCDGDMQSGDASEEGLLVGTKSKVCVRKATLTLPKVTGIFALRYTGPGLVESLGQIEPVSSSQLVHQPNDAWPWGLAEYRTFLVMGHLVQGSSASIVSGDASARPPIASQQTVVVDAIAGLDSLDSSQYCVFVVTAEWFAVPSTTQGQPEGDGIAFHVVGKVDDVPLPGATPTPTPTPSPGSALAPTGLWGSGDRPLTVAELATLWAADSAHLAGRIVIVKGPVPTGFECSGVRPTDAPATTSSCYANTVEGQIASEGYWAVRVGSDGGLTIVGEVAVGTGGFVVSLEEARVVWNTPGSDKAFVLMDAWIGSMAADACDVVGQPCYEVSWLASSPYEVSWVASSPTDGQVNVQLGAYHMFGGGSVGGGPALQGIFLIQGLADEGQVLARMEVAVP